MKNISSDLTALLGLRPPRGHVMGLKTLFQREVCHFLDFVFGAVTFVGDKSHCRHALGSASITIII